MIVGANNENKCIIFIHVEVVTSPSLVVLKPCACCFSCDPIMLNKWYQSPGLAWWRSGSGFYNGSCYRRRTHNCGWDCWVPRL